jgi:MoaA/NifB/PqqE/SkfB family radical SAM enzyme
VEIREIRDRNGFSMWDQYTIRRKINSLSRRLRLSYAPALPVRAWIAPTSRCNLKCRTCYEHMFGTQFQDMKPEVYERIRRDILPGLQEVYLTGAGEPFLAPIFYTILDDLFALGKRIWIVTNGTIVRPDVIERLVKAPAKLMVSLDGTTQETFAHVRPGAKIDRVFEFMDAVKGAMAGGAHPEFQFQISFVVMRSNLHQMTECVELAHRYGVVLVAFSSFAIGDRTDEFAGESLMSRPEEVTPYWEAAVRRGIELGVFVSPMVFDCRDRSEEERKRRQATLYRPDGTMRPCPVPWWDTYIETDGSVRPCCVSPPFGNILEQPFRQIWNGPMYRALRRTVNTPGMPLYCKQCFMAVRI